MQATVGASGFHSWLLVWEESGFVVFVLYLAFDFLLDVKSGDGVFTVLPDFGNNYDFFCQQSKDLVMDVPLLLNVCGRWRLFFPKRKAETSRLWSGKGKEAECGELSF